VQAKADKETAVRLGDGPGWRYLRGVDPRAEAEVAVVAVASKLLMLLLVLSSSTALVLQSLPLEQPAAAAQYALGAAGDYSRYESSSNAAHWCWRWSGGGVDSLRRRLDASPLHQMCPSLRAVAAAAVAAVAAVAVQLSLVDEAIDAGARLQFAYGT
jgi:hypothetical protein